MLDNKGKTSAVSIHKQDSSDVKLILGSIGSAENTINETDATKEIGYAESTADEQEAHVANETLTGYA